MSQGPDRVKLMRRHGEKKRQKMKSRKKKTPGGR